MTTNFTKNFSTVTVNVLTFTHNKCVIKDEPLSSIGKEPEYDIRFPDLHLSLWMTATEVAETIFNTFV